MRIIYLPLYADVDPFIGHRVAQARTSFRSCMNDVYWIAGSKNSETYFDKNTRILTLPVSEKFENIYRKTIMAFNWILENEEFDYVVRTNTSTYFDIAKIEHFVGKLGCPKLLAAGQFGNSPLTSRTKINEGLFLAGTAILVSRKLLSEMVLVEDTEWNSLPDDVAISMSISHLGVPFKELPRLDVTDYKPFSPKTHYRVKSWSDNRITVDRFYELDELLRTKRIRRFETIVKFHFREFKRYKTDFPIRSGVNSIRWILQIFRYSKINRPTWLWIVGKNV